ncbi:hypothetical protein OEZ85_007391 [Tetradesmus obliquus]|uniref:Importin N-terminal domain-containing protein n=1 Tax=Tetradesmus obliquus TaxID=3088 RepID=A0ABY8TFQ2_TETOB|nr:hypothetical protein OEZ85_007391 [Tetradesmus obliquus]
MDDPAVQQLAEAFARTIQHDREVIKAAEEHLKSVSQQPGYGIAVLTVIAAGDALGTDVRLAAAVNFKNLVKYRWVPTELAQDTGVQPIPDAEKAQIKQLLTGLMLSTPQLIRAQLSEALTIISSHDFPANWPQLLPELVERLNAAGEDLAVINGVCHTANSIFKRYRNQFSSDKMIAELAASQDMFAPVALQAMKQLAGLLPAAAAGGDLERLKALLSAVRLLCRIFFSLNSPGLTPLMEGQLDEWMDAFHTMLAFSHPGLAAADAAGDPEREGVLDGVKAAVCANINLFMETSEEEFAKFLQTFVTDVWHLLMQVSNRPGQDNLAMAAIRFLTTVARSVHCTLFADPSVLKQICESIILPNLRVRDEDEELFEMNPIEYIRRDIEGGDSDTRRRAAADLVKALAGAYDAELTTLCTGYVAALLQEHVADPVKGWRAKDCAVYLVMAVTVRGKTGELGATTTNRLVNISDFFTQQVLPELQDPAVNERPILKADALKFVTTFRSQLPQQTLLALLQPCTALLASEAVVVHSYAATAIERFLALREGGRPKLAVSDVLPVAQPLLSGLFAAFRHPDSAENEYLMRAVMRLISFLGGEMAPVAPMCLKALADMLVEVCKNPKSPGFNHYLFESVAALIKHGAAADKAQLQSYEATLFPAFDIVLSNDVQEFHPYVFQILAQLIELSSPPLNAPYMAVFPPLLNPMFWERPGNVPALTRLLVAYLAKAGQELAAAGHLPACLGVFQKLIASKANDGYGFALISGIVTHLPPATYQQYLPTVWQLLFTRLQGSKTPRFTRGFVVFLALAVCKLGVEGVSASMDAVQPKVMLMILQQVWAPSLSSADGPEENKLVAVAATKCLTESADVYAATPLWQQLRSALDAKLAGTEVGSAGEEDGGEEGLEFGAGYSAAYAKLANASMPERPVLSEIADPKQFAESRLASFMQRVSGS